MPKFDELIHAPTRLSIVAVRKTFVGKRPRTSARLTTLGRDAFDQHVSALRQIVAEAGRTRHPDTAVDEHNARSV